MLAGHLIWHPRDALKLLTLTDEDRPVPEEPVAAVNRSAATQHQVMILIFDHAKTYRKQPATETQ